MSSSCHAEASGCADRSQCGKLRLHYFNARGRGEVIRFALALAKADWEDVRYTFDDWKNHKAEQPLGQVPVLEVSKDGKTLKITQTATILRSLSCWFGLAGKTPCQATQADEAFEVLREIGESFYQAHFEKDAERKATLTAKFKDEIMPRNLGYLEKKLHANGGKHIAGSEGFTYGDLAIANFLDNMVMSKHCDGDHCKTHYPGLHALYHSVLEQPEIKAYIAKRPVTEM